MEGLLFPSVDERDTPSDGLSDVVSDVFSASFLELFRREDL
jgi:hypothetical protein